MRRTVGLTLLLVVLAIAVGVGVAWATFPSQKDLQRSSMLSLGLPEYIVDNPIVQQAVQQMTEPMQRDLAHKARNSAVEGGIAALGIAVVGAVLIEVDRRRQPGDAPPAEDTPAEPPA
jgi:ABC-type Fe3+ transport system permease subunit